MFQNVRHKIQTPWEVYADIECLLQNPDNSYENDDDDNNIDGVSINDDSINFNIYQKHVPYSIGYYLKNGLDDEKISRTGKDCISWFIEHMRDLAYTANAIYENPKPMKLTKEKEKEF